jgi:hypothetical protein
VLPVVVVVVLNVLLIELVHVDAAYGRCSNRVVTVVIVENDLGRPKREGAAADADDDKDVVVVVRDVVVPVRFRTSRRVLRFHMLWIE